jgi:hypothetical protein
LSNLPPANGENCPELRLFGTLHCDIDRFPKVSFRMCERLCLALDEMPVDTRRMFAHTGKIG